MIVKNEAHQIGDCLAPIVDLFDQIRIIDTGSTDGTPQLLRDRFGIEPVLVPSRCQNFSALRNQGLAQLETSWVLSLDADERLDRYQLEQIRKDYLKPTVAGYFSRWQTYHAHRPSIEDYKLILFRKGLEHRGQIHENVQFDIRDRNLQAQWLDQLVLHHYPDESRAPQKKKTYCQQLIDGIKRKPTWYRYHWFLGYTLFRAGKMQAAIEYLSIAAQSQSLQFPVECLNSQMVLIEIHAQRGEIDAVYPLIKKAQQFYTQVADDFEVKVNFRLHPWLEQAWQQYQAGKLNAIKAYQFAH